MITSLLVVLLGVGGPGLPAAESLVAKFLTACGGTARLRQVQAIRETGLVTVTDSGRSSTGPALLEEKRPNKSRVERTVFGTKMVVAYDGHRAWTVDAAGKPQLLAGEAAQDFADNQFDHFLLDYGTRGTKVTTDGLGRPPHRSRVQVARGIWLVEPSGIRISTRVRLLRCVETTKRRTVPVPFSGSGAIGSSVV